jgi:hypothetical protein
VSRKDLLALSPRDAQLRAGRSVLIGLFAPVLVVFLFELALTPSSYAAIAALVLIAAQGVAYWLLKERQAEQGTSLPAGLTVFRWLRWIDIALLAGAFAVIVVAWEPEKAGYTIALWLFAVLEYVSLFFIHLYYVPRPVVKRAGGQEWLRDSRLSRDLVAASHPAPPPARGRKPGGSGGRKPDRRR